MCVGGCIRCVYKYICGWMRISAHICFCWCGVMCKPGCVSVYVYVPSYIGGCMRMTCVYLWFYVLSNIRLRMYVCMYLLYVRILIGSILFFPRTFSYHDEVKRQPCNFHALLTRGTYTDIKINI